MSTDTLVPAADLAARSNSRFPGESDAYRAARTALLAEEIELRRHIERVAEQRRALPPGHEVTTAYRFVGEDGREHGLADLFGDKDALVVYSWMFGPDMTQPCPMCTALLASLEGEAKALDERIALAVVGRSPIERLKAYKAKRGWTNLRLYTDADDAFSRDHGGVSETGEDWAGVTVFRKDGDIIRHFWSSEGGPETADPGKDASLSPDLMPLWNVLDLTPGGRGADWYPKLEIPA